MFCDDKEIAVVESEPDLDLARQAALAAASRQVEILLAGDRFGDAISP